MRLLLSLKDNSGRVTVEGYLDDVRPISKQEIEAVAAMPSVDAAVKQDLGLSESEVPGERLKTPLCVLRLLCAGSQVAVWVPRLGILLSPLLMRH